MQIPLDRLVSCCWPFDIFKFPVYTNEYEREAPTAKKFGLFEQVVYIRNKKSSTAAESVQTPEVKQAKSLQLFFLHLFAFICHFIF